ncbi:biotin transporter BioY [Bradyrhizobium sp. Gha]|uniref:biotin transporter BioY n=1 Tax=Bradyrhizobium sp. Gha TaxID=1855318 RepID=UPI0008EA1556|nr:biotin transporter BioY [Bradyrhizobium sp. Gha]SFJ82280.1 biotin transport system substrate-specific component [Bradyrhizobium sp. Gha]
MESRAIVRIALLAAVIAALGMVPSIVLPIAMGVPITAQTLGVMLAGIILGPRHGALAVLLFLFVVLLGVPLLSGGRGGLGVLFGPSVGFLLGWVPAAFMTGLMMARLRTLPVFPAALVAAITGGIVVEYAFGILGVMAMARMSLPQALVASAVFVPGDLLKALATAFVAEASHRSYPAAIVSRS